MPSNPITSFGKAKIQCGGLIVGAPAYDTEVSANAPITNIAVYTPVITPVSVAANTSAEQTFNVPGLTTADKVIVNPAIISVSVGVGYWRVSAANTLAVQFINHTAGALTPTAGTWAIIAIRS